jgi:hypothetical protein
MNEGCVPREVEEAGLLAGPSESDKLERRSAPRPALIVAPARYVKLPLFEAMTGYTEKAIRRKIERGQWLEGREYRRAPDGNIVVDLEGYCRWVEGARARV